MKRLIENYNNALEDLRVEVVKIMESKKQDELASMLGISQGQVHKIMSGKRKLTAEKIVSYAEKISKD